MKSTIEVRVHERGSVRDGSAVSAPATVARCDLCGSVTDVVVSVTPGGSAPFSCKACLRERLEAITLGSWLLRDPSDKSGLPWGKISG